MIITVDKENIFQTIQNTFMIKKQPLGKIGQSRNFINKAKDIYKKICECIFLSSETLKGSHLKSEIRRGLYFYYFCSIMNWNLKGILTEGRILLFRVHCFVSAHHRPSSPAFWHPLLLLRVQLSVRTPFHVIYLGSLSFFIDLCICFYAGTILY